MRRKFDVPSQPDEEAFNGVVFRLINEWREDASDKKDGLVRSIDTYTCECADPLCAEPVRLTRSEYETVRSVPERFVIALNHEDREIDLVVLENERYAAVEKRAAEEIKIARATDPRGG